LLASARDRRTPVAANQEIRIQQLEGQIRNLNGQLEQMNTACSR
jgi:TolA-binding protein